MIATLVIYDCSFDRIEESKRGASRLVCLFPGSEIYPALFGESSTVSQGQLLVCFILLCLHVQLLWCARRRLF